MGLDIEQEKMIEQLYREMFRPLLAYARSALNEESLAEEAVQDTFKMACAKADDFLSSPIPKGWLVNTLKNVISNMKRSRAQLNSFVVSCFSFDEDIVASTANDVNPDLYYSGIVSDEDFALLKLIAIERYSMFEAAEEFGISVEACKKRVQRAKKKFQKNFEK